MKVLRIIGWGAWAYPLHGDFRDSNGRWDVGKRQAAGRRRCGQCGTGVAEGNPLSLSERSMKPLLAMNRYPIPYFMTQQR
jgi:hypothetical protein